MADSYDNSNAFRSQSFHASWHNDPNFNRLVPVPVSGANSNGYNDTGVSQYGMTLVNAEIMSPSSSRCRQHDDSDVDDGLADDDDVYSDVFCNDDDVMVGGNTNGDVFNPLAYKGRALLYYKSLIEESYKRETSAKEDKKVASLHKAPEPKAKVISQPFEMVYEVPVGRAVVPRTLYPTSNDKRTEYLKVATKILSRKSTQSDLENLVEFMEQTKKGIAKKINSKIRFHFVEQLKKEGVEYQNQPVGDVKGACEAFRHELTEDLCLKLLRVFWGSVEDNDIMFRMEYAVLAECNLWYSNANDDLSCIKDKRVVGFVKSHIANQIRMNFRKRFQRDIGHGVTLKVTQPGGRHKRRKKGEFGRSEIHGWNAPKHKEWKKQNNADPATLSVVLPLKSSKPTGSAEHLARAERNQQTIQLENTPIRFIQNAAPFDYSEVLEKASEFAVQPIMQVFGHKDPIKTHVVKTHPNKGHINRQIKLIPREAGQMILPQGPSPSDKQQKITNQKNSTTTTASSSSSSRFNGQRKISAEGNKDQHIQHLQLQLVAQQKLVEKQKHVLKDHQRNINYLERKKVEKEQEGVEKDLSQLDGIAKGVVKTRNNDRKKKTTEKGKANKTTEKGKTNKTKENGNTHKKTTPLSIELGAKKPFDLAPEDEVDITEIRAHKYYTGKDKGWWLTVLMESISGEYESNENQVPLTVTYQDCQEPVDQGYEDENLVLKYAKNLKISPTNKKFCEAVADLVGKPLEELFTQFTMEEAINPPKMTTPHKKCGLDHKDYSDLTYKAEESDYYFREKAKWYGLTCKACNKTIGTEIRPNPKHPVYICAHFALDKTNCKEVVCGSCFEEKQRNAGGIKPRRRNNK